MVLIYSVGNLFWIETFTVPRTSVADSTVLVTAHTLERGGIFLGGTITLDHAVTNNAGACSAAIRNSDDSVLAIGQDLTAFESSLASDSGSAVVMGAQITIFMRGNTG